MLMHGVETFGSDECIVYMTKIEGDMPLGVIFSRNRLVLSVRAHEYDAAFYAAPKRSL
jgi:hypothetical protein